MAQSIIQTPNEYYRRQLDQQKLEEDTSQADAIASLDDLYQQLLTTPRQKPSSLKHLLWRKMVDRPPIQGLYLWGGVGRGKTWLVDMFFNLLPIEQKRRYHFHRFMQRIHKGMAAVQGQPNPMDLIAEDVASQVQLICLDEFVITDIGDAMILAGLLKGMFRHGVTLVTTSNMPPQQLYEGGLQRDRFLPAIDLLQRHTKVQEIASGIDYRTRYLINSKVYHTPLGQEVDDLLAEEFANLVPELAGNQTHVTIAGRKIPVRQMADDVVWFDFMALCGPPRSQMDYLELARRFHTVLISDIPVLNSSRDDVARRFLYMLDEFYDSNVNLILSAAVPAVELYQGRRLTFEFQRATSRLREMRSSEYLSRPHKA